MSNTKHQLDLINICEMLLRKTYSINACISKEESSTFGGKKANETESKQREENTKYENRRQEINENQKQVVNLILNEICW